MVLLRFFLFIACRSPTSRHVRCSGRLGELVTSVHRRRYELLPSIRCYCVPVFPSEHGVEQEYNVGNQCQRGESGSLLCAGSPPKPGCEEMRRQSQQRTTSMTIGLWTILEFLIIKFDHQARISYHTHLPGGRTNKIVALVQAGSPGKVVGLDINVLI